MQLIILGLFLILSISSSTALSPALLLSPLIANNKIQVARNLSLVDPKLFLNVTSYTGFFTVEEKYDTNTFFWYFPVVGKPVNETPLIVWLQGGPGGSSLIGLFDEIGPFQYVNKELKLREWSWTMEYSVVFIDNPVGAGYSFTNDSRGFVTDMEMCADHLFSALVQFYKLFPELSNVPLYIAGESYAGRYLPALGMKIYTETVLGSGGVNLTGIIMGNPVTSREKSEDYTALFYQWGLIDAQGKLGVKPLQEEYTQAVHGDDNEKAIAAREKLLNWLQDVSQQKELYNVVTDTDISQLKGFEDFLAKDEIKEAIHVGDIKFTFSNATVHTKLENDFLKDSTVQVTTLLNHYNILIYCGQLDMMAACVPNSEVRRDKWFWKYRDNFMNETRIPWWFNNSKAGYVKQGGGLTEVLVIDAGHMVPMDKPQATLKLISLFIENKRFPAPPNYYPSPHNTPIYNITDNNNKTNNDSIIPENNSTKPENNSTKPENNSTKPENNSTKPENNSTKPENNSTDPENHNGAKHENSNNKVMVASIVINVLLVLLIVAGAVYIVKWKRRSAAMFYSAVDDSSLSDAVLTMT